MAYPTELIEKAQYELRIFDRVSAETCEALIAEVVELRAKLSQQEVAAGSAVTEEATAPEPGQASAGPKAELDWVWWIQSARRLMQAKDEQYWYARAQEADLWLAVLTPSRQVPEKLKSVAPGFKGLFKKEAQAYKQGWNECRGAMLQNLRAVAAPRQLVEWVREAQALMRATPYLGWRDIAGMVDEWLAKETSR